MDQMQHVKSQLEMSRNVHSTSGIDALRRAAQQGDEKALTEAAQQFEAIFVQMMLKSMRKAQDALADKDSPFNSEQVKFYRDMHDQQLATDLSGKGTLGLAELIVQQMSPNKEGFTPASALRNDGNLSSLNRPHVERVEAAHDKVLGSSKQSAFASPEAFVSGLMPQVQKAAQSLGLEPKALLAQAAVETGWGQHMIHDGQGKNSHNLFGIKADHRWQGAKVAIDTLEYSQGTAQRQKAHFRAYDSFEDALQDYVTFVRDNPRYQGAVGQSAEPGKYFSSLQQAGYATDPKYAEKILKVMQSETLSGTSPTISRSGAIGRGE